MVVIVTADSRGSKRSISADNSEGMHVLLFEYYQLLNYYCRAK